MERHWNPGCLCKMSLLKTGCSGFGMEYHDRVTNFLALRNLNYNLFQYPMNVKSSLRKCLKHASMIKVDNIIMYCEVGRFNM